MDARQLFPQLDSQPLAGGSQILSVPDPAWEGLAFDAVHQVEGPAQDLALIAAPAGSRHSDPGLVQDPE